jgi:hypothetical protein
MVDGVHYEIRGISFENFVSFLFDREVFPESENGTEKEYWYYSGEIACDPREVAEHYIRLFTGPEFLPHDSRSDHSIRCRILGRRPMLERLWHDYFRCTTTG